MDDPIETEMSNGNRMPKEVLTVKVNGSNGIEIDGLNNGQTPPEELSIAESGLCTLRGFPQIPSLIKLDLSNNSLEDGLEYLLGCPNLNMLNLSGNRFKDLTLLEPLRKLTNLKVLHLKGCDFTRGLHYRCKVVEMLPQVEYLDGYSRTCVSCDGTEDAERYFDEDDDYDSDKYGTTIRKSDSEERSELQTGESGSEEESDTYVDKDRGIKRKFDEESEM
ncbi:leucine Rich repeat-containing domain protein [Trichuris suis]|nr:leucine Rich repeat-containing domain protein [Trichuris suis]